ncbi:hypothetical protein D477_015888 [Arthrobacter crystallopoietes BAB-32]|uniref:Uncharacterized protein n=1 Tax=Arthrobacter crystallopoietes BAB-32 TaxID=1246476 RepID=N1UZI1_9MICC|nr:hypothetical protein [Arthrobacter crystallopoietes]EMY33227.1 hypothetical protein D477_015888 [Arthrobacter crystallopoietes BAB-32]
MPGFDERYDPIYQRGHSGQATGQAPGARSGGSAPGAQIGTGHFDGGQAVPRRPDHAPQHGRPEPFASPLERQAAEHQGRSGISEVVPADAVPDHDEPARRPAPKFNPFLLALWLLGLAALGLGVFAAMVPMGLANPDPFGVNPGPSVWMLVLPTFAPGLLTCGTVCLGLALAVHALAWQQRR